MLKKQNRLGVIIRTKENKLFTSPLFNVRISDNKENKLRFAFIVSKKIDKRAVVRNKTKRILRIAAEKIISVVEADKDVIIIAKKTLLPEQVGEVTAEMEVIFKNAGIMNS